MNRFNIAEMADMHFIYGLTNDNEEETWRFFHDRYSTRVIPCAEIFKTLHAILCKTVTAPELEETILNAIDDDPSNSTRKIALQFEVKPKNYLGSSKNYLEYFQKKPPTPISETVSPSSTASRFSLR